MHASIRCDIADRSSSMTDETSDQRPFQIVVGGEPPLKTWQRYSRKPDRRRRRRLSRSRRPRRRGLARDVRELHRKEWESSESLRHPRPSWRGRKRGPRVRKRGQQNRHLHRKVELMFRTASPDELETIIRDAWQAVRDEISFQLGIDPNG